MPTIHREQTDKERAASARGKRAIEKGKGYEREKVKQAKDLGLYARREWQFDGGKRKSDMAIFHDSDMREKWLHCEAKKWKNPPSVNAVMKQAIKDAGPGVVPVAIRCKDAEPSTGFRPKGSTFRVELVSMRTHDWYDLVCWGLLHHYHPPYPEGVETEFISMTLDAWFDLVVKASKS